MLFRVKIAQVGGERDGLLLAEADKIPIRRREDAEEQRDPLLPVQPADLGALVYRVDLQSLQPVLLVNRDIGDWQAAARARCFNRWCILRRCGRS